MVTGQFPSSVSVIVSHDGARLYLEGELFDEAGENTEIIDDWPLHPDADLKTNIKQLWGFLAGLSVVVGRRREHSEVAPLTTKPKIDII